MSPFEVGSRLCQCPWYMCWESTLEWTRRDIGQLRQRVPYTIFSIFLSFNCQTKHCPPTLSSGQADKDAAQVQSTSLQSVVNTVTELEFLKSLWGLGTEEE
jgi:hypothetical protein